MTNIVHCSRCGCELPADTPEELCPACLLQAGLTGGASDSDVDYDAAADPRLAATTPHRSGLAPPAAEELAPLFPQLEVLSLLGHGGMGAVYQARQKKLDRLVALKIIRPEGSSDPAFAERFMREARTLARLSHPGIVAVHDFGEVAASGQADGTLYYFVMEFVDGANLRQLMEGGELTAAQVLAIVPQVCEALQFAHDEGVVHRDIKPENILVDGKGRVKIADFGLAKLAARSPEDFTLTATHQVMGTPRYMAPEQMTGSHAVDHRADIYSLGVVLYEMLTGEVPLGQFALPSQKVPVDARLDDVVLRALAREPERRFQQASELKSRVDQISSGAWTPRTAQPAGGPYRTGVSTIMERELIGAWRWVAGDAASTPPASRSFPTAVALLLTIAGSLMLLLPWCDINIPGQESAAPVAAVDNDEAIAVLDHDVPLRTASFWPQTNARQAAFQQVTLSTRTVSVPLLAQEIWPGSELPLRPETGVTHTVHGTDFAESIIACVVFVFLTLVILTFPDRVRQSLPWNVVLLLGAAAALVSSLLFPQSIPYCRVTVSVSEQAMAQRDAAAPLQTTAESLQLCFWQSEAPAFSGADAGDGNSRRVSVAANVLDYTVTYRAGFVGSIALSATLIVLAATGIRNALTVRFTVSSYGQMLRPCPAASQEHVATSATFSKLRAEVRLEVSGPSLMLITVGCLSAFGHGVGVWVNLYGDEDAAILCAPGILVGIAMILAGANLRSLASRGWVQVGAVAGLLPLSASWILTSIAGIWAINTLQKPHVREAFLQAEQHRLDG